MLFAAIPHHDYGGATTNEPTCHLDTRGIFPHQMWSRLYCRFSLRVGVQPWLPGAHSPIHSLTHTLAHTHHRDISSKELSSSVLKMPVCKHMATPHMPRPRRCLNGQGAWDWALNQWASSSVDGEADILPGLARVQDLPGVKVQTHRLTHAHNRTHTHAHTCTRTHARAFLTALLSCLLLFP